MRMNVEIDYDINVMRNQNDEYDNMGGIMERVKTSWDWILMLLKDLLNF
jgi:hypothetical protein